ncbi:maltose ABC transporter substrate-binding protein, partial [Vibrio anguillarum]|nr:maltose ABC transporter substrate-binding protein [Vibrio anguillarum]
MRNRWMKTVLAATLICSASIVSAETITPEIDSELLIWTDNT